MLILGMLEISIKVDRIPKFLLNRRNGSISGQGMYLFFCQSMWQQQHLLTLRTVGMQSTAEVFGTSQENL